MTSEGARYHNLWFCDWYIHTGVTESVPFCKRVNFYTIIDRAISDPRSWRSRFELLIRLCEKIISRRFHLLMTSSNWSLFMHTRATWIQKISLIQSEMRALRAHKVCTCNKLDDFYKLWYTITQRAIVCWWWNFKCFLIETKARCFSSTPLKFSREKRVIFNKIRYSVCFWILMKYWCILLIH